MSELDARAGRAARAGQGEAVAASGSGSERYLTFMLRGEPFALPILDVTEILEYRSLTVVPMMPTFIRGVINLRGRVVPVVDLADRFGRGKTEIGRRTSIVIVEPPTAEAGQAGTELGVMVDAVNKVVHLDHEAIEPPPDFGAGIRADFISGMARDDNGFIIVLDVARVLSLEEMSQIGVQRLAELAATGQA